MEARPLGGRDYPRSLPEFLDWFPDDASCLAYLARLRWPDGFVCPSSGCDGRDAWLTDRHLYVCTSCRRQVSLTAGTIFEKTRVPLVQWFRAAWLVMSEKNGMSALGLQRQLGLSSYQTAWTMLHKFRTAMVRPGREKLHGEIEVDETYVGGPEPGRRGRQVRTKAIVAIGIETYPSLGNHVGGFGRIRMRMVPDVTQRTLGDFVWDIAEPGSVIKTDAWVGYQNIEGDGYTHVVANIAAHGDPAHVELPGVHRVASLLKRWLMGTHHGAVERQHLDSYLDEFTFRFNRRKAGRRGLLFYRLLQGAVTARPISYETIVWSRRGLALPPAERLTLPRTADADVPF